MMKYLLVFLLAILVGGQAHAGVWIVDSFDEGLTPTNGTRTLRSAINAAAPNDTIYIQVTGELRITSQLFIEKPLRIYGPAPVNFSISGAIYSAPDVAILIQTNTTDTLVFEGISIKDFNHNARTVHINPSSAVRMSNCLFKNNHNSGGAGGIEGGAISNGSFLKLQSVSFTNNHANMGGAIYNMANLFMESCSFQFNNALSLGGAIHNNGFLTIHHGTFYQNNASGVQGGGGMYLTSSAMGSIMACMFYQNTSSGAPDVRNAGSSMTSDGYNMLVDNMGNAGLFTHAGDLVNGGLNFGLHTGVIIDGYGMEYVPVVNALGDGVNIVPFSPGQSDIRRAPRRLSNQSGINYNADCGAFEFTPFVVTSPSPGIGTPNTIGWCINQINLNAIIPAYVGFHLSSAGQTRIDTQTLTINQSNTTIDGFSQPNSRVPGPTNHITPLVSGSMGMVLDGGSGAPNNITISGTGSNAKISGVCLVNRPNSSAIRINASGVKISGCHFGVSTGGGSLLAANLEDINIQQGSNHVIGGIHGFERNTFGRPGAASIYAGNTFSSNIQVINNVFGLNGQGNSFGNPQIPNTIYFENVGNVKFIRNVFANTIGGIYAENIGGVRVENNYFGINANGTAVIPNTTSLTLLNCSDVVVGGAPNKRNIFAGDGGTVSFGGVLIDSPVNQHIVSHNYIGLLPNGVTAAGNLIGVEALGSIGIGTTKIFDNVISGNNTGVNIIGGSSSVEVYDNIIGLTADGLGTGVGNTTGVRIGDGASNNIGWPGSPNYISGNNGNGILFTSSMAVSNGVKGNYIGFLQDGTTPAGNGANGIRIDNSSSFNYMGGLTAGEENKIAHNLSNGIEILSGANTNVIFQNEIHDNTGVGVVVDGASTNQNNITENSIRDNGGLGIDIRNGANDNIAPPEILGVTQCGVNTYFSVRMFGLSVGVPYSLEVFVIPAGGQDPSGFGEGNTYLFTDGFGAPVNGTHVRNFQMPFVVTPGDYISMVMRDFDGNTSEFSNHIMVANQPSILGTVTNVGCFGNSTGSIDATVTGGSLPLFYNWTDDLAISIGQTTEDATGLPIGAYSLEVEDASGCNVTSSLFVVTEPPELISSASSTNATCFGANNGTLSNTASGGTPGYVYSWYLDATYSTFYATGTSLTNVPPGTYYPEVVDANGCSHYDAAITISEPSQLVLNQDFVTNVNCAGGSNGQIQVLAFGGIPPYEFSNNGGGTYQTSGLFTGLSAGTYSMFVRDNTGCLNSINVDVTQPAPLTVGSWNVTNVDCSGAGNGQIEATGVAGGTPPFEISVNNGSTYAPGTIEFTLAAGGYQAILRDANGCQTMMQSLVITQPPVLNGSVLFITNASCNGSNNGAVNTTASGGTPTLATTWYSDAGYLVNIGSGANITGLSAGTYYWKVTDANGCEFFSSAVVNEPSPLIVTGSITSNYNGANISCAGISDGAITLTVTGGTPPFDYSINNGSSFVATGVGTTTYLASGLSAGTYSPYVLDANGCIATDVLINLVDPNPITANTGSVDVTCFGFTDGQVSASPTGGTGAINVDWYNNPSLIPPIVGFGSPVTGLSEGTYYANVFDQNGCFTVASTTIGSPPPVTDPIASSNAPVCENGNLELFASLVLGATYNWTGPNGFISTQQNPVLNNASLLASGVYSVTATVGGCTSTQGSTSALLEPIPLFGIAGSNPTVCAAADGSITLSGLAGTTSFNVTYNNGSVVNLGAVTTNASGEFVITGLTAGTYTSFSVTAPNGCTHVEAGPISLTDPSSPAAPMATSNSPLCAGDQLDLGASTIVGASYTWTGPNGFNSNVQAPSIPIVTTAASGTYSVTATVVGCTGPAGSVVVNVFPLDDATISPAGPLCLLDSPIILTAATSGGLWAATCGACINDITGQFDPSVAGDGSFVITYETSGVCPATDNETIVVSPFAGPDINPVWPFCENQGVYIMTGVTGGGTWSATCGACIAPITGAFDPTFAGVGTHRIYHQTPGLCGGIDSIDVEVSPLENAMFDFFDFCVGTANSPTNIVTLGGDFDFAVLPSDGATINTSTGEIIGATVGTTYDVRYGVFGWCPATHIVQVTALGTENASFTLADFCEGTSDPALITGVSGGIFSFNVPPSGSETIDPITGTIFGGVGGEVYQVNYTTMGTCPGSSVESVTAFSNPTIGNTLTDPSCWNTADGEIVISASGTVGPYLFSIDGGGSTQPGANLVTFSGLSAGTYDLYISDNIGCTNIAQVQLLSPSTVGLTVDVTNVTCNGAADGGLLLTASGGAGPVYEFTLNGGSSFGVIPAAGFVYNFVGSAPGNFTIFVLDANGCSSDTIPATIAQPAPLQLTVSNVTSDTCGLSNGTATFSITGGTAPYGYSINGGSPQLNPFFGNLATGTFLAGGADINGCIATQVFTVGSELADLSAQINPQVGAPNKFCPDSPIILSTALGFNSYLWTGPNLDSPTNSTTGSIVPADSAVFVIMVSNGGCFGTDSLVVYANIADCPFEAVVNNAFSPDGDGTNDFWHIVAVETSANNEVRIYNRWGDVLRTFFNYNNQDVVWDGTDEQGRVLPAGTYFYTIDAIDVSRKLSGWVYLIR